MDSVDIKAKMQNFFDKYKYVALIVALGIVLMLLPAGGSDNKSDEGTETSAQTELEADVKLADVLSAIQGVGEVKVQLSVAAGEEKIYQIDEDISDNSGNVRRSTVVISDASRDQQGLVKQVIPPSYLGAVVVCDGGDDPVVRLAVVDAVSKLTGLTTDRISVVKMK